MTRTEIKILLPSVILASALALLVSGCTPPTHLPKPVKPEDFPLTIRFDARHCPLAVDPPSVASCIYEKQKPDAVCRHKGEKIVWVAVKEGLLDPNQQFTLSGVPAKKAKDPCEQSSEGQLECKIDQDAQGDYKYSVAAGGCVLDPHIWVP
jgi:hypothetical protein